VGVSIVIVTGQPLLVTVTTIETTMSIDLREECGHNDRN